MSTSKKRKYSNKKPKVTPKNDDDSESQIDMDALDEDFESFAPKRPRDSNNIINVAAEKENLSREQICLLFLEVAKRLDQHEEFDIARYLQDYLRCCLPINFNEIAFIIASAGHIYYRKVDLAYTFFINFRDITNKALTLIEDTQKKAAIYEKALENGEVPPKKKRTPKKKLEVTNPVKNDDLFDSFFESEDDLFTLKPDEINPVTSDDLRERATLTYKEPKVSTDGNDHVNAFSSFCLRKKLMIHKITKHLRRRPRTRIPIFSCEFNVPCDNHDIPHYANIKLTDLDDNTVSGTRRDYFVFMGMIDRHHHTLRLTNTNRPKKRRETIATTIDDPTIVCDPYATGSILLPPEYVKNVYDVNVRNPLNYYEVLRRDLELWNHLGPNRHEERVRRCVTIAYSIITELMERKQNFSLQNMSIDQYDVIISKLTELCNSKLPPTPLGDPNIRLSIASQPDKLKDDTFLPPPPKIIDNNPFTPSDITQRIINSELRISVDDGISMSGCSGSSSPNPHLPRLCDLNPLERSLLDPRVELVDFCEPLSPAQKMNLQVKVTTDMLYLSSFDIPQPPIQFGNQCETKMSIKLNFLKLPLNKLRRKCEFALSPDFKLMRKRVKDAYQDLLCSKLLTINELSSIEIDCKERCKSPTEDNDFNGFEDVIFKTPNTKQFRTFSRDSGIMINESSDSGIFSDYHSQFDNSSVCENTQSICETDHQSSQESIADDSVLLSQQSIANSVLSSQQSIADSVLSSQQSIDDSVTPTISNETSLNITEPPAPTTQSSNVDQTLISKDLDQIPSIRERSTPLYETAEEDDAEVAERIKDWHLRMRPIISKSQKRSTFDIHAYAAQVIKSFPTTTVNTEINFAQLMQNKDQHMTARYFLTMLQMANNENIQIIKPKSNTMHDLVEHTDLKLKLLDITLRSEAMDESLKFDLYDNQTPEKVVSMSTTPINPMDKIMKRCELEKITNVDSPPAKRKKVENVTASSSNSVEIIFANTEKHTANPPSVFNESGYSSFMSEITDQ